MFVAMYGVAWRLPQEQPRSTVPDIDIPKLVYWLGLSTHKPDFQYNLVF
jgi:hypothetical protein